jgi:hypothetical protein
MRQVKAAKKQVKKTAQPKNRALGDMQRFYQSLDFAALWNDFYVTIDTGGRPKYKSAQQFAKSLAQNEGQLEFLIWLLGPKQGADPRLSAMFPFASPLDFDVKRETGGWFTADNLKAHSKVIREQINALEALKSAGNGITIHSLARMENLAERLDLDFGGRFFVDGLSLKDNIERARLYVSLHERLLHMIGFAQDIYAKSHGINFADMSGFERLLQAQALAMASSSNVRESRADKVMGKLIEMALDKSAKHGIQLPAEVEKVVVSQAEKTVKKSVM